MDPEFEIGLVNHHLLRLYDEAKLAPPPLFHLTIFGYLSSWHKSIDPQQAQLLFFRVGHVGKVDCKHLRTVFFFFPTLEGASLSFSFFKNECLLISFLWCIVPWLFASVSILPERGSTSKGSGDADLCRAKCSTCWQFGHLATSIRSFVQLETREGAARLRCHSEAELRTLASNHPGKTNYYLYFYFYSKQIIITQSSISIPHLFPSFFLFLHMSFNRTKSWEPIRKQKPKTKLFGSVSFSLILFLAR